MESRCYTRILSRLYQTYFHSIRLFSRDNTVCVCVCVCGIANIKDEKSIRMKKRLWKETEGNRVRVSVELECVFKIWCGIVWPRDAILTVSNTTSNKKKETSKGFWNPWKRRRSYAPSLEAVTAELTVHHSSPIFILFAGKRDIWYLHCQIRQVPNGPFHPPRIRYWEFKRSLFPYLVQYSFFVSDFSLVLVWLVLLEILNQRKVFFFFFFKGLF